MKSNTSHAVESQEQSQKTSTKKPKRRLDHMRDLADGMDQYDQVPRKLSRAYINGDFPESKFRLLLCMMSHAEVFHIKRSYLQERFSDKTLAQYLPELELEGYIEVEELTGKPGKPAKLYHVRSMEYWELYRQHVNPHLGRDSNPHLGRDSNPHLGGVLKKSSIKESKRRKANDDEIPRAHSAPGIQEPEKTASSFVRDHSSLPYKSEELRPSDYVNLIGHKIKTAKIKDGKVVWIPQIGVANKAAKAFIEEYGHEMMHAVCDLIIESGRTTVCETMFLDVLPYLDRLNFSSDCAKNTLES